MRISLDIAVVGCGVGGQAAATLLADAGHRVTLVERFAEPRPLGAGLLLQPTGLAVLARLGLDEEALALGARIDGLDGRTAGGRRVLDLHYRTLHPRAFGLGIHRGALFELLYGRLKRSAASLVTSTEIVSIEQDGARAYLSDTTGTAHGPFDVVIVADGAHSALRERLMPEARALLYPWGCVWATVTDDSADFDGMLRQRFRGTAVMMGLLPVGRLPDDAPGTRRVTLFWSLPIVGGTVHPPADIAAWKAEATALWPEARALVERIDGVAAFTSASYRHVALSGWSDGPVVFMGDAAHGTSPQLGQGANLVLLDAHALVRSLAGEDRVGDALRLFEQRRVPSTRFYRHASHLLTPLFQSNLRSLGWLRDAFMGPSCHLPVMSRMMASTLAGTRRGWLGSTSLDVEGRYPLD